MSIYGLILAGGQGSRLGHVRKGDLRLGGRMMRDRVAARLDGHVDALIENLADLPDTAGPLAGIAAAVDHLRSFAAKDDILVSVAVDTPFLPADYVSRIAERPAAYAAWHDSYYPTNAAYRLGEIMDLPERAAAIGSPKRLLLALRAEPVSWSGLPDDPFANLNTLADLLTLARREE